MSREYGSRQITTAQHSVDQDPAVALAAERSQRIQLVVTNVGTNNVYLGPTSAVTSSSGLLLPPDIPLVLFTRAALYGICASGETATVSVAETYD